MAKKENTKKRRGQGFDKAEKKVYRDVSRGKDLTNRLGFDEPLSRISTEIPEDQRAAIESLRQLTDPSSEAFIGKRSAEEMGALGSLRSLLEGAGSRSADMESLLGRLKSDVETKGQRTGETADYLARLKSQADIAGRRSQEMQDTLNLMRQGLAGLSSQENQALREQAQREVDRKYQTAVQNLQSAARAQGFQGGAKAGARNARRDAMMAQADLEQKNLLANIDVQDRRRGAYAGLLGQQEQAQYDRGAGALRDYGSNLGSAEEREAGRYQDAISAFRDQLTGLEGQEFNQRALAAQNYFGGVNQLSNAERDRVRNALGDYSGALGDRNQYFLDTSKVNLGQERTDRAARIQSALGLAGLSENERARKRALKDSRRRSTSSSSQQTTQQPNQYGGFASDLDRKYYEDMESLLNR